MVPSSPFFPWRAGKITSTWMVSALPSRRATSPWTEGSGERKAGVTGPCSQAPERMSSTGPVYSSQRPSLVMPTMCTSYRSLERFSRMEVTDIRETSCSEETPPKITARLSLALLFIAITPHAFQKKFFQLSFPKGAGWRKGRIRIHIILCPRGFRNPSRGGKGISPRRAGPAAPPAQKRIDFSPAPCYNTP